MVGSRVILTILGCAALAGCARATAVGGPSALSAAFTRCPLPVQWETDDRRPVGIRIRNDEADTVAVFLDRCMGHSRVGDVGPGRVRTFRLEPPLIDYGNGLRFYVYPGQALDRFYVALLPVDTARVLSLTITPARAEQCDPQVYVDGQPYAGSLRELGVEQIAGVHLEYERGSVTSPGAGCPVIHVRTRTARQ